MTIATKIVSLLPSGGGNNAVCRGRTFVANLTISMVLYRLGFDFIVGVRRLKFKIWDVMLQHVFFFKSVKA